MKRPTQAERDVLPDVRLALSKNGCTVFRNNVGLAWYGENRDIPVQYGVCNPGGSDLIGWQSVIITPEMVGQRVAVFLAIETKNSSGGRKRAEQENFIAQVRKCGGLAARVKSVEEALRTLMCEKKLSAPPQSAESHSAPHPSRSGTDIPTKKPA